MMKPGHFWMKMVVADRLTRIIGDQPCFGKALDAGSLRTLRGLGGQIRRVPDLVIKTALLLQKSDIDAACAPAAVVIAHAAAAVDLQVELPLLTTNKSEAMRNLNDHIRAFIDEQERELEALSGKRAALDKQINEAQEQIAKAKAALKGRPVAERTQALPPPEPPELPPISTIPACAAPSSEEALYDEQTVQRGTHAKQLDAILKVIRRANGPIGYAQIERETARCLGPRLRLSSTTFSRRMAMLVRRGAVRKLEGSGYAIL
jgi:hypothetical protein